MAQTRGKEPREPWGAAVPSAGLGSCVGSTSSTFTMRLQLYPNKQPGPRSQRAAASLVLQVPACGTNLRYQPEVRTCGYQPAVPACSTSLRVSACGTSLRHSPALSFSGVLTSNFVCFTKPEAAHFQTIGFKKEITESLVFLKAQLVCIYIHIFFIYIYCFKRKLQ